jgi:hypothetical protein
VTGSVVASVVIDISVTGIVVADGVHKTGELRKDMAGHYPPTQQRVSFLSVVTNQILWPRLSWMRAIKDQV